MARFTNFVRGLEWALNTRDILQINATIIAGLLILLSISSLYPFVTITGEFSITGNATLDRINPLKAKAVQAANDATVAAKIGANIMFVAITILPFVASSIAALIRKNVIACFLIIVGFFVILGALGYLYFENVAFVNDRLQRAENLLTQAQELAGVAK